MSDINLRSRIFGRNKDGDLRLSAGYKDNVLSAVIDHVIEKEMSTDDGPGWHTLMRHTVFASVAADRYLAVVESEDLEHFIERIDAMIAEEPDFDDNEETIPDPDFDDEEDEYDGER